MVFDSLLIPGDQTKKLRDVMAVYLLYRCKHLCILKFRALLPSITKKMYIYCILESCAGQVNPRGLRVPTFAGRVRELALLYVRVRGGLNLLRVGGGRGMRNSSCG